MDFSYILGITGKGLRMFFGLEEHNNPMLAGVLEGASKGLNYTNLITSISETESLAGALHRLRNPKTWCLFHTMQTYFSEYNSAFNPLLAIVSDSVYISPDSPDLCKAYWTIDFTGPAKDNLYGLVDPEYAEKRRLLVQELGIEQDTVLIVRHMVLDSFLHLGGVTEDHYPWEGKNQLMALLEYKQTRSLADFFKQ